MTAEMREAFALVVGEISRRAAFLGKYGENPEVGPTAEEAHTARVMNEVAAGISAGVGRLAVESMPPLDSVGPSHCGRQARLGNVTSRVWVCVKCGAVFQQRHSL